MVFRQIFYLKKGKRIHCNDEDVVGEIMLKCKSVDIFPHFMFRPQKRNGNGRCIKIGGNYDW